MVPLLLEEVEDSGSSLEVVVCEWHPHRKMKSKAISPAAIRLFFMRSSFLFLFLLSQQDDTMFSQKVKGDLQTIYRIFHKITPNITGITL